jgi:hypothetical protein
MAPGTVTPSADPDPAELGRIADLLYGLDPAGFTAARDECVSNARRDKRRALATAIKALRRPSLSAWAVNQLARRHADEVGDLVRLGDQLRQAQAALAADPLRALGQQRNRQVAALVRAAAGLADEAGHGLSEAAEREVAATLEAAVADPDAGLAVRSGRLVRALEYAGFGAVDLDGAMATEDQPAGAPVGDGAGVEATEEQDAVVRDAQEPGVTAQESPGPEDAESEGQAWRAAVERMDAAQEAFTAARRARAAAQARVEDEQAIASSLEQRLASARRALDAATADLRAAEAEETRAADALEEAAGDERRRRAGPLQDE